MSAKKSFKANNPALSFISTAEQTEREAQEEQKEHGAQDTQEVERVKLPPTQGRKGQKLPRINMAFSPENLEHIQIMGRVTGCSATEYVNRLIAADREKNKDIAEQAHKFFTEVNQ